MLPLLIFLAAKGLSHLILMEKLWGNLKGIEVATNLFVTHLLFVDDILLFSHGSRGDIQHLKASLDLFLKATSMCIDDHKSSLVHEGLSLEEITRIHIFPPFEVKYMKDSFKYLGFHLSQIHIKNMAGCGYWKNGKANKTQEL